MAGFENDIGFAKNFDFTQADNQAPSEANGLITNGQLWIGRGSVNAGGTHIDVNTLTPGTGITISNGPGTITIASTASLTDLHTARFIVASSTTGTGANYTSIASAITAAVATGINSTIFLQPGTYTENFTLPANINLCAFACDAFTPNVIISGTITCTTAGTRSISGIRLQTNSAALLAVTGSAASIVNLNNCYLNCSNNTGITFSSSSSSAAIVILNCLGNIGTTGISLFSHSSSGALTINNSSIVNTGGSTTASTISAGSFNTMNTSFQFPITFSGTGGGTLQYSVFANSGLNTTMVTLGGSGAQSLKWCRIESGSASAISIGGTADLESCVINSSNTNAVSGAGTVNFYGLMFTGSSSTINTTTQTTIGTMQGSKNTAPSAGFLGEQVRSAVASGSAVSLSNGTAANITTITLSAGIWDVTGVVMFKGAVTGTASGASIGTTSATTGTQGDNYITTPTVSTTIDLGVVVPPYRLTLTASTTTVYLVGIAVFGAGTQTAYGRISATRVG